MKNRTGNPGRLFSRSIAAADPAAVAEAFVDEIENALEPRKA